MFKILHHPYIWIFIAIFSFFIIDIAFDTSSHPKDVYFFLKRISILLIVVLIVILISNQLKIIKNTKQQLTKTKDILQAVQGELATYIDNQFDRWGFTKAEKEIAWLIVKGYSSKEISTSRSVNERTVHAQLSSIYKKSDTKNKHELLSSFLEEFMNLQP